MTSEHAGTPSASPFTPAIWANPIRLYRYFQRLRDDPISTFEKASYEMPFTESRILSQRFVGLNDPELIGYVLLGNHQNYTKGRLNRQTLTPVLGEGLLTSEGSFWRRQRRIAAPAFHHSRVAASAEIMTGCCRTLIERWRAPAESGDALDILEEMAGLTMEIVARALFSSDISGRVGELSRAITVTQDGLGKVNPLDLLGLPEWLPRRRGRSLRKAIALLRGQIDDLIKARRRSGTDRGDLLDMLLKARDADSGESMSDAQLVDEILTLFAAGHETTAVGLTWTWYLLSQHPMQERALHAEIDKVLGGREPGFDDLRSLRYTRMAFEEALRLYPPAYMMHRVPIEDDVIGGHRVAAGTLVSISPYLTHRNPRLWEDPERFDPERFSPQRSAGRHRFAYIPFGGGPRICIGNSFAMMEAQLVLAMVAQRYRLRLLPGFPVVPQGRISLRPRYGMRMVVEGRR